MTTLHIDFETRSTVDLRVSGVYPYTADPSTDVWCAAYAVDDGPIEVWTPGSVSIKNYQENDPLPDPQDMSRLARGVPQEIIQAVREGWQIVAHNANFERIIWRGILGPRYGWPIPKLTQWRCTMAMALAMSLPAALVNAAAAVALDTGKDMGGRDLMLRMAKPRNPRKGEDPKGIYWFEDDERKQRLYTYCKTDVEVERQLHKRLLPLSPMEQKTWWLDQVINDRGVYVDVPLCEAALKIVDEAAEALDAEMNEITGGRVQACTNVIRLTEWLRLNGCVTKSLDKASIDDLLTWPSLTPPIRRALELRREAAKASVKKIEALLEGRSSDNRARGLTQYHAASTGRWAGRRFQPHNIKRPELKGDAIDNAIEAVATGDINEVRKHGQPLAVVGDCLRGMITAAPGRQIMAADFSNIEGRGTAWLAGEEWKLQAFRDFDAGKGPDIYKLAWARSFGKNPEDVTDAERQGGKVQELALGYQGGVGALQKMAGAYGIKVSDETADEWKLAWREVHPRTVVMWADLEDAAISALCSRGKIVQAGRISFRVAGSFLWMRLPSGRSLCYPYPRLVPFVWVRDLKTGRARSVALDVARQDVNVTIESDPRDMVSYKGVDSYTRKWTDCYAYGGLWTENAVQALARDILRDAMFRLERAGYPVILTVHDEAVVEPAIGFGSLEQFREIMCVVPAWAEGLPVAASAWEGERYRKQ